MTKKKRALIVTVCCLAFLGLAGLAVGIAMRIPPDFSKLSDQKVLDYLKSGKAKKLDKDQLLKLGARLDRARADSGLMRGATAGASEADRRNMRDSGRLAGEAIMDKRIHDFFALDQVQQDALLDSQIAQMDQRMQQFAANRPAPPAGGNAGFRGRRRDPNAMLQRRRNMLSNTTPQQRAERREYFRRLMARRAQTGHAAPAFGGRRRGAG